MCVDMSHAPPRIIAMSFAYSCHTDFGFLFFFFGVRGMRRREGGERGQMRVGEEGEGWRGVYRASGRVVGTLGMCICTHEHVPVCA